MQFMLLLNNGREGAPEPEVLQGIMADFAEIRIALGRGRRLDRDPGPRALGPGPHGAHL